MQYPKVGIFTNYQFMQVWLNGKQCKWYSINK